VDDEGVVALAQLLDRIDHASDLEIAMLQEVGIVLGLTSEQFLLFRRLAVPGRNLLRPWSKLAVLWNDAGLDLVFVDDLAIFVPTHIKPALVAAAPIERRLVGCVGGASREIGAEWPVGCDRLLRVDPCDALIGQVARQLIAVLGPLGGLDGLGIADERRKEL